MAPSSVRRSPGKELKKGNSHKRGQSLESGLPSKTKDDELMLFNEVQKHETVNFLSHISDDFDDSVDFKLGITIPVRGESSDLLDIVCDKNDCEWLLTPPDTPLFPSLDDDEPQPPNISRGRTRSQPVPISRSYMNEKTHRTSRSSVSPHRLSLSPQSCHGITQTTWGPSSTPHSGSPLAMQQRSTLQSSTTPTKPSTSIPRSSTPTLQRTNYGTNGQTPSSNRRGISPANANRAYSTSPKLRGWQSDLPGFPTEAPSNLRTFLPDWSASHVRGSSSASQSLMCSSSKYRRRSMSPSNSRSASLPQGHERHQFTSCRRASLASDGDGLDSVQFIMGGISENSSVRKHPASMNNKRMISYKRTPSFPSASTDPRRSFDSLEHQKAPRNMFRPLLSSVSSNKLYAGKTNSEHGSVYAGSLSRTASDSIRFESGFNCVLDAGKNDLGEYDLSDELKNKKKSETQEELLVFDKFEEVSEDNHCGIFSGKLQSINKDFDEHPVNIVDVQELESAAFKINDANATASALQSLHVTECSGINHNEMVFTCFRCGKHVLIIDVDEYKDVCQECAAADKLLDSGEQGTITNKTTNRTGKGSLDPLISSVHLQTEVAIHPEKTCNNLMLGHDGSSSEMEIASCPDNCSSLLSTIVRHKDFSEVATDNLMDMNDQKLPEQLKGSLDEVGAPEATSGYSFQQRNLTTDSSLTFDTPGGTGISLQLMRRSSSMKWPIMRGRTLSATSIICSEPSYTRDSFNSMKRSIDRESSSASSSIDLGSSGRTNVASRKTDICVLRQFSSRKDMVDNVRSTSYINSESIDSHSEVSVIATEVLTYPSSEYEEDFCGTVKSGYKEDTQETQLVNRKHRNTYDDNNLRFAENIFIETAFVYPVTFVASDASRTQVSCPESAFQLHDAPGRDYLNNDDNLSTNGSEVLSQNVRMRMQDVELDVPVAALDSSSIVDNLMLNDERCRDDISGLANYSSSNLMLEQRIDHCFQDKQNEKTKMPDDRNDLQEGCFLTISNEDLSIPASESNCVDHSPSAPRSTQKTFTWEEATDTVLFCSSIVHDLAHKAATMGMEREMTLLEAYSPTSTHLATPGPYRKDFQNISNKGIENPQKVKRRIPEIDPKTPLMGMSNEVSNPEIASSNAEVTQTPDSMKPPPVKLGAKCSCAVM